MENIEQNEKAYTNDDLLPNRVKRLAVSITNLKKEITAQKQEFEQFKRYMGGIIMRLT